MAHQKNDMMDLDSEDHQLDSDEANVDLEDDHRQFDNQRLKWIAEISESVGRLYTNLNALNRNIESVNLVGSQFENVYNLWSKFEEVMSVPSAPAPSNPNSPQQTHQTGTNYGETNQVAAGVGLSTSASSGTVIEASVELHDPNLPPGVAPGGGMTTWGVDQS